MENVENTCLWTGRFCVTSPRCRAKDSVAATVSTSGSGPPKTAWMDCSDATIWKHKHEHIHVHRSVKYFIYLFSKIQSDEADVSIAHSFCWADIWHSDIKERMKCEYAIRDHMTLSDISGKQWIPLGWKVLSGNWTWIF